MTLRKHILAALIAALAVPAVAYASSSGLTQSEIESGSVPLLSQRSATTATAAARRPQQARAESTNAPTSEDARHNDAMDKGLVRMTKGSMLGGEKK